MTEYDSQLLHTASAWLREQTEPAMTTDSLRLLTKERGIDFATAALYLTLRQSSRHGEFIQRVDALKAEPTETGARIVIVPGAFYKEKPATGGDGRLLKEVAARLGFATALVPLQSFGRVEDNANRLAEWLREQDGSPLILVTHSKSSTEMRCLLARPDAAALLQNCIAWVDVSGLFAGTPIIDWLRCHPLRAFTTRLLLWWLNHPLAALEDISRDACPGWPEACAGVPHLQVIHVVGFPLQQHLTVPLSRRGYRRLSPLGPNDSVILLGDALSLPGLVYPVWGADHYLKPRDRDMPELAARIVRYVFENRDAEHSTAAIQDAKEFA
jgi:hypothetical protein